MKNAPLWQDRVLHLVRVAAVALIVGLALAAQTNASLHRLYAKLKCLNDGFSPPTRKCPSPWVGVCVCIRSGRRPPIGNCSSPATKDKRWVSIDVWGTVPKAEPIIIKRKTVNAISPNIIPENETQRMAAVRRYDILDTPPDGAFDRITAIASRRFNVPISIISIVDHDRIWFKSHHGLDVHEIGRAPGLCASAILSEIPHILPNALTDPRSLANPLVAGDFGLRFYAGVPLRTHDGFNLGTLCVIDREPRPVDQQQIDDLRDLASVVMDQMELRLSAREALNQAQLMAKEIDHRVTNSLQFISGLLAMHGRSANPETENHLKMAANRVAAVAQVHRNFYTNEGGDVSCITFLRRLCEDLSGILGRPIDVQGDEGKVPSTRIQPIGLMVNELVTNAAKHGAGRIDVRYQIRADHHELSVSDEGEGLPDDFDADQATGLGMKVLNTLVKQLGGEMTAQTNPAGRGSSFKVAYRV